MQRRVHVRRLFLFIGAICLVALLLFALIALKVIHPNSWLARVYIKGVDISHYQGNVDMDRLAEQGIDFVFIKATEGSSSVDEMFSRNWGESSQAPLFSGAYHFFSFDSSGSQQAKHFIQTVGDLSGRLLPVVDIEYYGKKEKNPPDKEKVVKNLTAYLSALEKEYGVKPMIYTTYKVYFRYIRGEYDDYPLWIRNVFFRPSKELGRQWDFWQYSDTAKLDGYKGREPYIDCNVFNGSMDMLGELTVP